MKTRLLPILPVLISLFGCSLFPSPHTKDADYVVHHGRLEVHRKDQSRYKTPLAPVQKNASSAMGASSSARTTALSVPSLVPERYADIQYPAFHYVAPYPKDYRVEISDSITGYLVPDRSLPFIRMNVYFRESTLPGAPNQVASLSLLSVMYRRGGSTHLSAEQLDDSLELLAAGIGGDLGDFNSSLALNCLSRDFPATLALLEDVFTHPAFDSSRLELQKNVYLQNLQHKYDRPSDLLSGLSRWAMYQSSPRLWNAQPAEVKRVKRADLLKLAPGHFAPRRVIFALSGDFDRDSMATTLKAFFDRWPKPTGTAQASQQLAFKNKPGIYVVDKDVTQANISMEQPFVRRPHPDYYAASVASYILGGGGFTSRLTLRIRSDEGLAYSVRSFAESDYDDVGSAGIRLQTKVSSAAYAIQLALQEVNKLAESGPTPEELEGAKAALIESLPGIFDSPANTASAFARSEVWGRSFDHFKDYPAKIRAVTAADVQRCIRTYFDPKKMTISIVGPVAGLEAPDYDHRISLSDLGKIRVVPMDSLELR
ncbi:MAG TPA: pitrilysin family protein [Fibrobacteraceae bacterium]|nr:pitrilysin family protein [Fibrobacteraceae bacterium]